MAVRPPHGRPKILRSDRRGRRGRRQERQNQVTSLDRQLTAATMAKASQEEPPPREVQRQGAAEGASLQLEILIRSLVRRILRISGRPFEADTGRERPSRGRGRS